MTNSRWISHGMVAIFGLGLLALSFAPACAQSRERADDPTAEATVGAKEDPLMAQVEQAIEISKKRQLTVRLHTPWQIMHGVMALGRDFTLKKGGRTINACDWLSSSADHWKTPVFEVTEHGARARPTDVGGEFQGHRDQFLAVLAMNDFPRDQVLQAGEESVTIADMVKHAQMHVDNVHEPSFTLIALSHYLGPRACWTNKDGEDWSIERLVRQQLLVQIADAPCGGTHALFALAYARRRLRENDEAGGGVWVEADQTLSRYVAQARELQNDDGSFSTTYFKGLNWSNDYNVRLSSSGHMLEWLTLGLPRDELRQPWLRAALTFVTGDLIDYQREPVRCGPLYHACHALVIYRDRLQNHTLTVAPSPQQDARRVRGLMPRVGISRL